MVCFGYSYAETVTITMKGLTSDKNVTFGTSTLSNIGSFQSDGFKFEPGKPSGSNITDAGYNKAGDVRIYAGTWLTITAPAGANITAIAFNLSSQGKKLQPEVTVDNGTIAAQSKGASTIDWSGASNSIKFTVASGANKYGTGSGNGQLAFDSVTITYTLSDSNVAAPIITLEDNNMVSISQEEGGDIYYTTNGDTPSAASTPYNAPFAISGKTTVKAIAYVDGEASPVTSKTLTPNTVANIAEFITLTPTGATKINAPVTAIYQNGKNLYIKDADDNFILVFGTVSGATDVQNGDVFSFITGTYSPFRGLPELVPTAIGTKSAGTEVDPYEVNLTDIDGSMLNQYVVLSDVAITYTGTDNKSYTMADADGNTLALYNNFYDGNTSGYTVVEIPEGEGFTVYGFVSTNNGTPQLQPILVEGGVEMETVATPVINPEGGDLTIGDKITITCATEGASIYYTTEDETPDATSIPYTGEITFSEAMTIRAIAIKDGMLPSDVATATFTVYDPNKLEATFDFTANGKITEQTSANIAPSTVQKEEDANNIDNITLTDGYISLSFAKNDADTNPRWWANATNGNHCRTYAKNTFTVKADNGYQINAISFTQTKGSTDWNVSVATNLNTTATELSTKEWTSPESGVTEVTFTATAKCFFGTMTVTYGPSSLGAIDDIFSDADANAPVEYYNLQGIRVAADNLTPGFYVVRQGSKTAKVLIRK